MTTSNVGSIHNAYKKENGICTIHNYSISFVPMYYPRDHFQFISTTLVYIFLATYIVSCCLENPKNEMNAKRDIRLPVSKQHERVCISYSAV